MMFFFTMMLVVINARFEIAYTKMYEEILPQEFKDCLNMILPNSDLQRDPAYIIDYACTNKFLTSTPNKRWAPEKDEEEFTLITNKINKLDIHTSSENVRYEERSIRKYFDNRHKKRSAVNPSIRRKEYRRMSPEERADFHRALQLLKDDAERTKFNMYDILCNFHHASRAPHAHFGPAFLSWHRVSLYIFEQALRSKVPGVFLPFWDSRLEAALENPSATSLFSDELMGPGNGVVQTGHFANWSHPFAGDLVRNVGNLGEPIQKRDIERLLKARHTKEFMFPSAYPHMNLELIHGKVHMWVSGTMNNLNYSPADPIFWMHHCFIDYVWEKIRQTQKERGVDPLYDYPTIGGLGHRPYDKMKPFDLKNRDGYLIDWSTVYKYETSPVDIICRSDSDCGSEYYVCENGNCRAKTADEVLFDRRLRRRRSIKDPETSNVLSKDHYKDLQNSTDAQTTPVFHSMQNTFMIDGREDSKSWVDLPLIVYSKRPDHLVFSAHPYRRGEANFTADIFQPTQKEENVLPLSGNPATKQKCQHMGSGMSKVYIRSIGVNYEGDYTSEAIIDERQALTMTLTQIAVQNPYKKYIQSYISAYDQCGRMCAPYCLTGRKGTYKKCSGNIGVDSRMPRMYNADAAGTILKMFDFKSFPPKLDQSNIFLIFYCGQEEKWPWEINKEEK